METPETKSDVTARVEAELARLEGFHNLHGITPANVRDFLVEPFAVSVDPDDAVSQPRLMWVVLQEKAEQRAGYVIVYDLEDEHWGVAEHVSGELWILVASAATLAKALSSM